MLLYVNKPYFRHRRHTSHTFKHNSGTDPKIGDSKHNKYFSLIKNTCFWPFVHYILYQALVFTIFLWVESVVVATTASVDKFDALVVDTIVGPTWDVGLTGDSTITIAGVGQTTDSWNYAMIHWEHEKFDYHKPFFRADALATKAVNTKTKISSFIMGNILEPSVGWDKSKLKLSDQSRVTYIVLSLSLYWTFG